MIRDIAHNHNESKPGLMAIIECNLELSLSFEGKPRPVMILWPCSRPHLVDTFDRIISWKGLTKSAVLKLPPDDQKALKKEIEDVASEEYLAVLFIKQADEIWYGELKTNLENAYLNPTSTEYGYPRL